MQELTRQGDRRMTTKEVAKQLGCDIHTITNHANRLFPGKLRNGVKTYFNEKEITLILESIKNPIPSGAKSNLVNELQGTGNALPADRRNQERRNIPIETRAGSPADRAIGS
jgi:hypothetical protein